MRRSLRLRMRREKDPVLEGEELDLLATLCEHHLHWIRNPGRKLSEAVLRTDLYAETALEKLRAAGGRQLRGVSTWPETQVPQEPDFPVEDNPPGPEA